MLADPQIIPLSVEFSWETVPETKPCITCDLPAHQYTLRFEFSYAAKGQQRLLRADDVPSFRCDACQVSFYNLASSLTAMLATHEVVAHGGDSRSCKRLQGQIDAARHILASTAAHSS